MRRLSLRRLVVVGVAGLLLALLNVPPALAQPTNDDFDSATVISALPFVDSISTVDATNPGDDPFCNGFEHTVWYSFTPTQDTTIRADTVGSDYATSLGVYTGSRGALSEVACASGAPAQVAFTASANTTYFFMVASVCCGNPGGNLVFRVNPPPANDDFDNATVVDAVPFGHSVFTADATTAADDPSCNGNAHSVWYAFTPTRDLPVRADTAGSDYATSLGVYTGSRGALSEVACVSSPAQVAFNASANTTYFFMVAGVPGGNLVFNVSEGPPTMTASLTGRGTLVAKGAAVDVEIAYSCFPAVSGAIGVNLTQRVFGKLLAKGSGFIRDFVCDGAEHTATVTVLAQNAPFKKGDAVGQGNIEVCSPAGCVFARLPTATVRIG
jgi:hypothetical protein